VHKYYTDLLLVPTQARKKTAFASGVTMGFVQFVTFSFYAGAFYYGGWLVEHKYVDFDGFMKALFVLAFMASGAGQAATFAGNVTKSKISTSTIFQLIDRVPPIDTQPWDPVTGENRVPKVENTIAKEHFKGKIVLENIYFAYPTRADADVFTGMSLEIEAGQSVGTVVFDCAMFDTTDFFAFFGDSYSWTNVLFFMLCFYVEHFMLNIQ